MFRRIEPMTDCSNSHPAQTGPDDPSSPDPASWDEFEDYKVKLPDYLLTFFGKDEEDARYFLHKLKSGIIKNMENVYCLVRREGTSKSGSPDEKGEFIAMNIIPLTGRGKGLEKLHRSRAASVTA